MELIQRHEVDEASHEDCVSMRVGWHVFEAFLKSRGDSGPRFSYLDGVLEIMSPSLNHEVIAKNISRMLEVWSLERDVELNGAGSLTIKESSENAGVEPDECYFVGPIGSRETPDLAIEVVWKSPLLDKLEIYRRLGVREVWVWESEALTVWRLGARGYSRVRKSRVLPTVDLKLINRFAARLDQHAAVKAFRTALKR